ncbi:MAG: YybH family protein [Solirubrobacterales bacterium]
MDRAQLTDWIEGYERAWRSPGTETLARLFTDDATYSTAPYENPHRGLEAIGAMWEAERVSAGEEFEMASEMVAVEGDTGVVRVEVHYGPPNQREYRDLWIVRLDGSGRCFQFEEWPFWPPGSAGTVAAGTEG